MRAYSQTMRKPERRPKNGYTSFRYRSSDVRVVGSRFAHKCFLLQLATLSCTSCACKGTSELAGEGREIVTSAESLAKQNGSSIAGPMTIERVDHRRRRIDASEKYDTWQGVESSLSMCICINTGLNRLADTEIYISYDYWSAKCRRWKRICSPSFVVRRCDKYRHTFVNSRYVV